MEEGLECVPEMKAGVVLALVFLLCHSSLQRAEVPPPKLNANHAIIKLKDSVTRLKVNIKAMDKYNKVTAPAENTHTTFDSVQRYTQVFIGKVSVFLIPVLQSC